MHSSTVIQSSGSISEEIRNEIDRFESVHPCIYAIYDLLEFIPDLSTRAQLRDHMMTLEDSIISSRPTTPKESNSICDNEFSLNHDDIELIDGSPTRIFTENRRSFDFFNNTKDDIIFSSFNRFFKKRSSYQNIETFKGIQLPSTDLIRRRKTKMNGNTAGVKNI
uniref:Small ribosomal subunit protein RACK1 n=1 Tax=Strongyloides stercoralis TaxID=6248 RepID=A0AAF5D3W3_STRER